MLGESLAYATHATLVQVAGDGLTWTSNARFKSKDKKRVLAKHDVLAGPGPSTNSGRRAHTLSKMPLLLLKPNCQRSFAASRFSGHNLPDLFSTDVSVCPTGSVPMDRGRQGIASPPGLRCLTSLWPLARWQPPMSRYSFGGIAKYNGLN